MNSIKSEKKSSLRFLIIKLMVKIWPVFKRKIYWSLFITILASISELFTLFILLNFLSTLIQTGASTNPYINIIGFNYSSIDLVGILLTTSFFSAFVRSYCFYLNNKLSAIIGTYISTSAYSTTLKKPYSFHISNDISTIITKLSFTGQFIGAFLFPLFLSISALFLAVTVLAGLLILAGKVTIFLCLSAGVFYYIVSLLTNKRIKRASKKIPIYSERELKLIQDSLSSIRDIKLDENHEFFINIFKSVSKDYRQIAAMSSTYASLPKFWVDAFAIGTICFSTLILVNTIGYQEAIPIIAVIALGAQRLLPSIQTVYGSIAVIRSNLYSLEGLLSLQEDDPLIVNKNRKKVSKYKKLKPIDYKYIEFKSITFSYNQTLPVIKQISLKVDSGQRIGICGLSGSGKSTLLDIMMGLIEPSSGEILIDGHKIKNSTLNETNPLSSLVAHVPQECFLADLSIAENIAFGLEERNINYDLIHKACKIAQIHEFILSLPANYKTIVGENGQNLSGGQKQRIAIARAIYKQKPFLILDEATSALDTITENYLINSLFQEYPAKNIVLVAHRLSTLKYCDYIYVVNKGIIAESGTYSELININGTFSRMLNPDKY